MIKKKKKKMKDYESSSETHMMCASYYSLMFYNYFTADLRRLNYSGKICTT